MRKVNVRHFEQQPTIKRPRSGFNNSFDHITTCNVGDLIPFAVFEVLPGDTWRCGLSSFIRLQSLLTPAFGYMNVSVDWFFVPNRIVWEHFEQLFVQDETFLEDPTTYTVPQVTAPSGGWLVGTIAEKIGIPIGIDGLSVSALYFRAFALIYKEWYRNEALQEKPNVPKDDSDDTGSNGTDIVIDLCKGGMCPKATKLKDLFTSLLPSPQKGEPTVLPLGDNAPVYASSDKVDFDLMKSFSTGTNLSLSSAIGSSDTDYDYNASNLNLRLGIGGRLQSDNGSTGIGVKDLIPNNLFADLSSATSTTVAELRMAFQLQKFKERTARSGSRYFEYLNACYGVISPDARLQRPEYLGGEEFRLYIDTIYQQSQTDTTPQGHPTGISATRHYSQDFIKSFTEHGMIFGLLTVRYSHSYDQGLPRKFSRKNKLDFHDSLFNNIAEQPVYNKEIYAQGTSADDKVYGYSEPWIHYKFSPNMVSGEMHTQYALSLDSWHFGDKYASLPVLSASWILENHTNIDRALTVTSANSNQLYLDLSIEAISWRELPVYNIPGLIDHG